MAANESDNSPYLLQTDVPSSTCFTPEIPRLSAVHSRRLCFSIVSSAYAPTPESLTCGNYRLVKYRYLLFVFKEKVTSKNPSILTNFHLRLACEYDMSVILRTVQMNFCFELNIWMRQDLFLVHQFKVYRCVQPKREREWWVRLQHTSPVRNLSTLRLQAPSTQDKHCISWAASQSYTAAATSL